MRKYEIGDRIGGFNIAQIDRWIELPLKCNYDTILYLVDGIHLFDLEAVDIMWWKGELWG